MHRGNWLLFLPVVAPFVLWPNIQRHTSPPQRKSHVSSLVVLQETRTRHWVDGIECVEVVIDVPLVGPVTVLEATAESQEDLVNLALEEEDEKLSTMEVSLNAGDPYGAVLWPAASAIASYLMTNLTDTDNNQRRLRPPLEGYSILELGTGTGLISLAASLGGAKRILATDYESVPLRLLEYAAKHLNSRAAVPIQTELLDLCCESTPLPFADLVVAADILYEPNTGRAMARRAVQALRQKSRVLVGDSPGRAGRPAFLEELRALGVRQAEFVQVVGWTCCGPRHELICGKGSRSVSETPEELPVDVLDLDPATCFSVE